MKEQLITFETAKLAKEKGFKFNEDSEDFYKYSGYYNYGRIGDGEWSLNTVYDIETLHWGSELTEIIDTPTQSLLQKWLREIHNIDVNVLPYNNIKKYYEVYVNLAVTTWSGYSTYEKALEIGLLEGLKLLEDNYLTENGKLFNHLKINEMVKRGYTREFLDENEEIEDKLDSDIEIQFKELYGYEFEG